MTSGVEVATEHEDKERNSEAPNTSKKPACMSSCTEDSSGSSYVVRKKKRNTTLGFAPKLKRLGMQRGIPLRRRGMKRKLPRRRLPLRKPQQFRMRANANRRKRQAPRKPVVINATPESLSSISSTSGTSFEEGPYTKQKCTVCGHTCCGKRFRRPLCKFVGKRPRKKHIFTRSLVRRILSSPPGTPPSKSHRRGKTMVDTWCQKGSKCAMLSPLYLCSNYDKYDKDIVPCQIQNPEITVGMVMQAAQSITAVRAMFGTERLLTYIKEKNNLNAEDAVLLHQVYLNLELAEKVGLITKVQEGKWVLGSERPGNKPRMTDVSKFRVIHLCNSLPHQQRELRPPLLPTLNPEETKHNPYLDEEII